MLTSYTQRNERKHICQNQETGFGKLLPPESQTLYFISIFSLISLMFQDLIEDSLQVVVMSLSYFLYYDIFQIFIFFITLTVLRRTSQIFYKMFLHWGLSDVFLMISL